MSTRGQGPLRPGQSNPFGGQQPPSSPGGGGGYQSNASGGQTDEFPVPSRADLLEIIQGGDSQKLVEIADRIGKELAKPRDRRDKLSTSQIRAFFGTVREIEMKWPLNARDLTPEEQDRVRRSRRDLLLLKPKLAYQAARARHENNRGADNLRRVLDPAIDLIGDERERFQNFVDFFEGILAYHRFYGGD